MTMYDVMFEAINEQYENGEITFEQAEELNDLAYDKYVIETSKETKAKRDDLYYGIKPDGRIDKEAKVMGGRDKDFYNREMRHRIAIGNNNFLGLSNFADPKDNHKKLVRHVKFLDDMNHEFNEEMKREDRKKGYRSLEDRYKLSKKKLLKK